MNHPIYFLPGTMCDQRLWLPIWDQLPQEFEKQFIGLDQGNSFEALEKHLLNSLPNYPVHLVGFSMGGYVALRFALAYPERIHSLILIASSAKGLKPNELKMRENTLNYLNKVTYNGIALARIRQLVHPTHIQNTEIVEVIKAMDKDLGKSVLISQLEATSKRSSLLEHLPQLEMPVFLIGSDHDQIVAQGDLQEMYRELEDGKLAMIEDCGHMIPLEKPWETAQLLTDWIRIHC